MALRLLGQGAEFLALALLARRLGPSEFGQLAVGYLACRYAGLVADWGASIAGTRDVATSTGRDDRADGSGHHRTGRQHGDDARLTDLATWRLELSLVLTIIAAIGLAAVNAALAPLSLSVAGRGAGRDWLALGRGQAALAATPSALVGLTILIGAAAGVGTIGGAARLIGVAWLIGVSLSFATVRLPSTPRLVTSPPVGWYLVVLVADQLTATADLLILGVVNVHQAGLYAAAYRFPSAWITLQGLVITGTLPAVAGRLEAEPSAAGAVRATARRFGTLSALGVLAATVPALAALPFVFGEPYAAARPALAMLMAATSIAAFGTAFQPLYFTRHSDRALAFVAAAVAGFNVLFNLWAIPRFGIRGAAGTTIATQLLMAGFLVTATRSDQHNVPVADRPGR